VKQELARKIIDYLARSGMCKDPTWLAGLKRRQWEQVIQWLDEGGLTLFWWNRCKTTGSEALVPAEVRAQLDRNLLDNALRVAAMAEEFDSINRRFEELGVRYVALKGFALIPAYFPDAALRTSYDYDYLVSPDSMERAAKALISVGYHRTPVRTAHHVKYAPVGWTACPPPGRDRLYSRQFRRTVELHPRLWNLESLGIRMALPEKPWERRQQRTSRGLRFYGLWEEDELTYQVLHVFWHILNCWCRLGSLFEIAYFLDQRAGDSVFWEQFWVYLGNYPPLPRLAGAVFQLAAGLFGAAVPEAVRTESLQSPPDSLALWVERYGRAAALNNFARDKHSSLFLLREFIEIGDEAAWRHVRGQRLFPLHLPGRTAKAPLGGVSAGLKSAWKQRVYIAERLAHHLKAAILYSWHSPRWKRMRGERRGTGATS